MAKRQPSYTKEFKQEAVRLVETSNKNKAEIARGLGISDSALSKWCKEFIDHGEQAFPGKGHQTDLEEKVRQLQREVEILKQERDILKKTSYRISHNDEFIQGMLKQPVEPSLE
ncbi:MAG TPA: transposase [Ktedonobacteraceae bacterium]|nr:transposase [Ktedonobacteraceae bacterium]